MHPNLRGSHVLVPELKHHFGCAGFESFDSTVCRRKYYASFAHGAYR